MRSLWPIANKPEYRFVLAFKKMITKFINKIKKIVSPVSQNEETARREFIFHIILLTVTFLSFAAFLINLVDWMRGKVAISSFLSILIVGIFFVVLYIISKKGYSFLSTLIFCGIFFLLNSYIAIKFGVDIPSALLTYALIVVITGILMGTKFAFISAVIVILTISITGYFQISSVMPIKSYWRSEVTTIPDLIFFVIIFLIIATVSWLSNREIEKSLIRARKSEAELKIERDNLEITVEERTREIKEMQLEKMGQLYRFAEFGKLSSGLFHDLTNPLTAVSLNMELVKNTAGDDLKSEAYLDRALTATRKMEGFIASVRKQISRQENKDVFSLNTEIQQVIEILSFKTAQAKVKIHFAPAAEITTYGDNIQFSQVALNLIGNAIDSYHDYEGSKEREVIVSLTKHGNTIHFMVKDYGAGISEENKKKIFEPFFTTKDPKRGTGIGLSLIQGIIEKDFEGTITVESAVGSGSTFSVYIPHRVTA